MKKYSGKQQDRSGQIPAFGNWDQVKELPITQYFENARQAGLKTCSNSTSHSTQLNYVSAQSDIYHPPHLLPYNKKRNTTIKAYSHEKKADKISYTASQRPNQLIHTQNIHNGLVSASHRKLPPVIKPVDEDLYKIPTHLLQNSKRKKLFGFFSRCFLPHTI